MRRTPTITMDHAQTVASAFEDFLMTKRTLGVKTKSLDTYSHHFHAISKHLDTTVDITEISVKDLNDMILSMQKSDLSPNTIKSYTITLKAFFSWCNSEGLTMLNMKKYKGEDTVKETYTDDELMTLLKKPNLRHCSFTEFRGWVIVNLLVNNGCRAGTIRSIQNRDVDLQNCIIHARHTKNGKPLVIPLCSELCIILKEYMKIRRGEPQDYLFCNEYGKQLTECALRRSISRYNQRRGISKTSIHLFRHTFASTVG